MIHKKLKDFKPIEIDSKSELDTTLYENLSNILQKINRSQLKSSHSMELIKDDIENLVSNHNTLIQDISKREAELKKDIETIELGLIDYIDILYELKNAAETINNKNFIDTIKVALKAAEQINLRLGIYEIAKLGESIDLDYHFGSKQIITDNQKLDGTIAKIARQGYRREKQIIRKATVDIYKYEE